MKIDTIYVSGYRDDLRLTQCCIASIRHWHPQIRICLIKDELSGAYDTSTLEREFDVEIFAPAGQRYGWCGAKFEPLLQERPERFLYVDSDVIFAGPVLQNLERYEEDFIVEDAIHPPESIRRFYFDPKEVERLYPGFCFPGYVFNAGQFVATSGILNRSDFLPFITFEQPRRFLQPDLFKCGDQGFLNFVLFSKNQEGRLTLRRADFMRCAPEMKREEVDCSRLHPDLGYHFLLHWAGPKTYAFEDAPMQHVLAYFDDIYRQRLVTPRHGAALEGRCFRSPADGTKGF